MVTAKVVSPRSGSTRGITLRRQNINFQEQDWRCPGDACQGPLNNDASQGAMIISQGQLIQRAIGIITMKPATTDSPIYNPIEFSAH